MNTILSFKYEGVRYGKHGNLHTTRKSLWVFRTFFHNVIDLFGPDHRTSKDKTVQDRQWSYEEIPTR